jgi:hypothetical protein
MPSSRPRHYSLALVRGDHALNVKMLSCSKHYSLAPSTLGSLLLTPFRSETRLRHGHRRRAPWLCHSSSAQAKHGITLSSFHRTSCATSGHPWQASMVVAAPRQRSSCRRSACLHVQQATGHPRPCRGHREARREPCQPEPTMVVAALPSYPPLSCCSATEPHAHVVRLARATSGQAEQSHGSAWTP